MSWFSGIISGGVDKVVDSVSKGLDSLFTSDEERLKLRNALQKEMNNLQLELENKSVEYEKEVTKRWESDNEHFITRLVRPISYIFILVLFALMVLFDGNLGDMHIQEAYIPVIETLLVTMTIAYFGSRGAEKVTKFINKDK
jgi:uncharacterized membrane protein (DUF106 family)